jgi:hypothetical protein
LALIGRYYALYEKFDIWGQEERGAWRTLGVLRHPPREMAAGDLLRLREALMTARDTQGLILLNAVRELRLAKKLGVAVKPAEPAAVQKFCTMDNEEYRKDLTRTDP